MQGVVVFVEGDVFFRFEELAEEEFVGGGDEVEGDVFNLFGSWVEGFEDGHVPD